MFKQLTCTSPTLLYHYTNPAAGNRILESGQLWLSPYACTRDPREAKQWEFRTATGDRVESNLHDRLDWIVRYGARIACFTLDAVPSLSVESGNYFHRGWARASMWDRYADRHTGLCLVFDSGRFGRALDQQYMSDFGATEGAEMSVAEVAYEDLPAVLDTPAEDLDDIRNTPGFWTAVSRLYTTKNRDWESEHEYRALVAAPDLAAPEKATEPYKVNFNGSLIAVILGEQYPGPHLLQSGLKSAPVNPPVFQCTWTAAAPGLQQLS